MSHRRIDAQPLGVVGVLVTGQAAEDRLAKQADHRVPRVLSGSPVVQKPFRRGGQPQHLVEFAIRQQPGVGGDLRAVEFDLDRPVKTHPESVLAGFTHRIPAFRRPWHQETPVFMRSNAVSFYIDFGSHPGNPGSVQPDGAIELVFAPDVDIHSLVGTTYDLFEWPVGATGSFSEIIYDSDFTWDTSRLHTVGEITLVDYVPEPATLCLLAFGAVLLRRRHRERLGNRRAADRHPTDPPAHAGVFPSSLRPMAHACPPSSLRPVGRFPRDTVSSLPGAVV